MTFATVWLSLSKLDCIDIFPKENDASAKFDLKIGASLQCTLAESSYKMSSLGIQTNRQTERNVFKSI